jgi:GTP cyclohydrolase IA
MAKRKASAFDGGESTSLDGGSGSGSGSGVHSAASTPVTTPTPSASPASDAPMSTAGVLAVVRPVKKKQRMSSDERLQRITAAARTILECLDDDPDRQGLRKTPARFAKALLSLTAGYRVEPADVLGDAQFDENHTEMVLVRSIDIFSHCEHHLLPFHGLCHVAYIPNGSVIGLSKIARIVDLYSHRLQVQERLTTQIAEAVLEATCARGVMVYISCTHMCMVMRGVQKVGAETVTTVARGVYKEDASLRQEFLSMIKP